MLGSIMQTTGNANGVAVGTVAIVDDDPRIRRLLEAELEELGYAVACFENAFNLLEQLDQLRPALILLDLLMPQIDGIECLRRIRSMKCTAPVIVFTALSDNEKRKEAEEAGASDYILKPDLFENLSDILDRHLQT